MGGGGNEQEHDPRALTGRGKGEGEDWAVIRAVDWLKKRGLEVNLELWDGVYEIAQTAKRPSVRLRARQLLLDRIDPVVHQVVPTAASAAGVTINLAVGHAAPDAQLQADGFTLHLPGGHGHDAGGDAGR